MYPRTSHRHFGRVSALALLLLLLSASALRWGAPAGHTAAASAAAAPQITSLSAASVTRSGRLIVTGTGFGATQADGRIGIGGATAHVSRWSDTQIVAYVSEQAPLGGGFVRVLNAGGASNQMPVEVTARPAAEGRIKWRFTVDGDYVPRRAALGPDGTVYVNDVRGRLYALTPDGGLKWIFQAGLIGAIGSVSVGGDGTVYVGGLVPKDPATTCQINSIVNVEGIFAVNPDGTQKWLFAKTCDGLLSGPDVGPDGKIHAVTDSIGIGAFALNPDGTLGHAPTGRFGVDGSTGTEVVFGPAAPGQAPSQKYFQYESGGLYGYTLGGQQVFLYPTNAVGITQPVAGQRTGTVYTVPDHQTAGRLFAVSPQGALRWVSSIRPIHSLSIPDAPPSESAVYIVQDGGKLHRVNPEDGSIVWTFTENQQLFDPVASPDDRLVLMGGRPGIGQSGFFQAVSRDGSSLWKQHLPTEPGFGEYGHLLPSNRARFTADGRTAYIAADILGDDGENVYSYFYSLDTSDGTAPINQPPTVTMTSPTHNAEVALGTQLDIKARVQDDGQIARVEFFNGPTLIGTDTTPDADGLYGVQFTPTTPGSHSFVAVAYDAGGLSGRPESSTNIWVTDRPPTVSWVAPTDGAGFAAPASIALVARAADSDGSVAGVEFKSYQAGVVGYNVLGSDTTPDADGNYQIEWANPPQGTYEITATATDNSGLSRGAVITITVGPASMPKYTIGGTVRDSGGLPLPGVNVTLGSSVSAAATTGADGSYQFGDLQGGGSYSVTASKAGYSFSPSQHVFSGLGANQTANFTGTRNTHVISGQIKDNNNVGLTEVALNVNDGQTTTTYYTSTNGNYMLSLPAGGSYTVTPTLVNYTFAPVSQSFNNLSANQTANFTGTRNAHGINGRVLTSNGYTLRGVTVTLTGSQTGTATTDPSGYFSFNLPAGGTYTVTPSHPGYAFSPASLTFSNLSGIATGSFTATSTNQPPRVTVTSPANNSTFAAPATLTVTADAGDADGAISKVEFYAEYKTGPFTFQTISLGSDTTAPYRATFTYSGADSFNLRAVATDDRGTWTPSDPVFVTFTLGAASQTPGWQKQFAAARTGLNGAPFEVLGFSAVDERHAWASHINAKVSRTTDGGLTWETVEVAINGGNNNHAQDVDFVDTQTGWVVGGEDNAVLRSTDGGRTYVRQPTGLAASLFGVEALDVNTAIAVGHGNTERDGRGPVVLRTRDGGATWVEVAHPFRFFTRGSFYAVHFINQTTGWAVGGSGIAIKTTNGGSTWTDVRVPTELPLSDVSFADANNGWVVGHGGVIFRTADGGATWQQQNVGTADAILSVSAVSPTVAWIGCYGFPGFVARTADGGATWHREYPDVAPNGNQGGVSSYSAVLFLNAESGWAAGYSGIYRRGAVASPTPTPAPTNGPVNVALAANGGTVTVSSSYDSRFTAASLNNGDRKGLNWGTAGGGWNDATGNAYPDWVQVDFAGAKTINEVDVFTVQDNFASPSEPTEGMTFSKYGVTRFDVQYWTGAAWAAVPNGVVNGNNGVWRKLTFAPVTTSKIRVVVSGALDGYSRLVEVEAWGTTSTAPTPTPTPTAGRVNVALASNGATANASSQHSANFPASAAINGDRRGVNWGSGGGWNDGTPNSHPDWLEVTFNGSKTIDEVDVFTVQDAFASPAEPTEAMTFTQYGATSFEAQYWTGAAWAALGNVSGNNKAWRRLTFAPVTTTKIRVVVTGALAGYSRLVEVEAWQADATARTNHALASNGASASASSTHGPNFAVSAVNNGDRKGLNWGGGGGWNDGTPDSYPDWVQIDFAGTKTISEVNLFTVQDSFASPTEPTEGTTFTLYGVTQFDVQAWDGAQWVTVQGGAVTGNNLVWRKLTFPAVTTTKIRVLVKNALGGYSRLTEVEAY